jgi:glycosyltransferase involved in cell wall biosynthesis
MARRLESEGVAVFFLRPSAARPHLALLSHPDVWPTPNLGPFDLRGGPEPLVTALRELGVSHLHVHSLVGFDMSAGDFVRLVAEQLEVRYDFTAHDYVCFCPRINLIGASGLYCGEPDLEGCEQCVRTNGSPFGSVSVSRWREGYHRLLHDARTVFAPGEDVATRLRRHFPDAMLRVEPHVEEAIERPAASAATRGTGEPLRVAMIGALGPHKGYNLLRACARDATERGLAIEFHVVGYTCDDAALGAYANVMITGRYDEDELPRLLAEQRCHCAWFASVWPETYSYTLSSAIEVGLYPVAFDLGVIAERIRALGWGATMPLTADPSAINDALLRLTPTPAPAWESRLAHLASAGSVVGHYYRLGEPWRTHQISLSD